jgi:hypothetical protein
MPQKNSHFLSQNERKFFAIEIINNQKYFADCENIIFSE